MNYKNRQTVNKGLGLVGDIFFIWCFACVIGWIFGKPNPEARYGFTKWLGRVAVTLTLIITFIVWANDGTWSSKVMLIAISPMAVWFAAVLIFVGIPKLILGLAGYSEKPWANMGCEELIAEGHKYIDEMVATHGSIMDLDYLKTLTPKDYMEYGRKRVRREAEADLLLD